MFCHAVYPLKSPRLCKQVGLGLYPRHPVGMNDCRQVATDGSRPPSSNKKATSINSTASWS
ncbi:hypothetical protein D0V10_22620 [Salmonella enterica]|nr:hypothetical protein [Salmonella enterica]EEW3723334.1 hypothetical protein [Escherichia coli]EFO2707615.1 hypothetical protein [Escherichia coli]MHQ45332.1 hypothetical protein [Salmonella enterica]